MLETATFGAGCFWGVEHNFQHLNGVVKTEVGYAGGHTENPTYQQVCSHNTGHAEVVQVTYDTAVISYPELLKAFWKMHDPTTLNRQGPDFGDQYRSVVFYHTEQQREQALMLKEQLDSMAVYGNKIVTEIVPAPEFYPAEDYHQKYYDKRHR